MWKSCANFSLDQWPCFRIDVYILSQLMVGTAIENFELISNPWHAVNSKNVHTMVSFRVNSTSWENRCIAVVVVLKEPPWVF